MTAPKSYLCPSNAAIVTRLTSGGITFSWPPDEQGRPGFASLFPTGDLLRALAHISSAEPDEAFDVLCRLFGGTSMEAI